MNKIIQFILSWLSGFITLTILDFLWLGYVIQPFIVQEFQGLITVIEGSIQINLIAGLIAWSIITLGCTYFVAFQSKTYKKVILKGGFFGFVLYACFDLTNLTFLNNYSILFTIVDIIWGTFVCSMVSLTAYYTKNKVNSNI
ncbi:MAG: DUF2177 family protein [Nanoarchaeota archaeon]|nr:DUF2177 family protein [Nanoarchaeota archaeon]